MQQGNVYVGFLQYKKLTHGSHTWYGAGYVILEMEAKSRKRGGVKVFCRE